jgi:hypothetical protein
VILFLDLTAFSADASSARPPPARATAEPASTAAAAIVGMMSFRLE